MIPMERAYVLISCEAGEEHSLSSHLSEIPEIQKCLITYGSYDLVAEIVAPDALQMNSVISSQIRILQNIKSTITLRVTI